MSSFKMSADLFRNNHPLQTHQQHNSHHQSRDHTPSGVMADSRIPVASPKLNTFRRSSSMRLRGERLYYPGTTATSASHTNINNTHHHRISTNSNSGFVSSRGRHHHHSGVVVADRAGATARPRYPTVTTTESHNRLKVPPGLGLELNNIAESGNRVRSLSLSLSSPRLSGRGLDPRTPPTSPDAVRGGYADDDLDSLNSYTSLASTASCCDHPFVAHNGTTFSGRNMKYVVHCSTHAGQTGDEYLTPTQRAQKQIKRLKFLLHQAKLDIEQKDSDILCLTKEVFELRLYKASLNSPEDKSNSSEAVTVRECATDDLKTPDSPTCTDFTDDAKAEKSSVDMQSSFADSGHFDEDLLLGTSKVQTADKSCLARLETSEDQQQRVVEIYEKKLEDLIRLHGGETQDLKEKHCDKIEELLQRLSDVNIRYCELVPSYDQARERIQELEKQLDDVNKQLQDTEEKQKQLYLQMYNKGIEAAKLDQQEQVMALATTTTPSRVSVSELLQQLQVTQTELENIKDTAFMVEPQAQSLLSAKEAVSLWVLGARKAMYRRLVELKTAKNEIDPEITLKFLKSAIYYFLTDKENHQGHLKAIQSILGFTPKEILNIDKARTS